MRSRYGILIAICLGFTISALPNNEVRAQDQQSSSHESTMKWLRRQFRTPTLYEKRHDTVLSAYEACVRQARLATVTVELADREVALGTIVRSDGYILTKASEVEGQATCILANGRKLPAKLVGVHRKYDLAMLHVEAKNLPTIVWRDEEPAAGLLVATAGQENTPVSVGVVSVAARKIESPSGVLGVLLHPADEGALIEQVIPGSSAEKAGLQDGDTITTVNGRPIASREELIRAIGEYLPGDHVRLRVARGNAAEEFHATLGDRNALQGQTPLYVQNTLGGPISARRSGFPRAIQHDTVLEPHQCGGPVVDLEGRAIGLNIARAGRVASYAIPARDIKSLMTDFIAGAYAPHDSVAEVKTASTSVSD
jgi:serine protease Do